MLKLIERVVSSGHYSTIEHPAGSAAIQAKQEAVAALVMMDCAQPAAEKVVSAILKTTPNATVVQLIKEALAQLKRV